MRGKVVVGKNGGRVVERWWWLVDKSRWASSERKANSDQFAHGQRPTKSDSRRCRGLSYFLRPALISYVRVESAGTLFILWFVAESTITRILFKLTGRISLDNFWYTGSIALANYSFTPLRYSSSQAQIPLSFERLTLRESPNRSCVPGIQSFPPTTIWLQREPKGGVVRSLTTATSTFESTSWTARSVRYPSKKHLEKGRLQIAQL